VTVDDHFKLVASVYDSLRTTDEAPVRRIRELLPDAPLVGLDLGCGTGRYSRLLIGMLPDGSLLAASDASAAMLTELQARCDRRASVVPLRCTAEELPIRTGSLDLVTAFNSAHHFDLGRFLAEVARVLRADGRLFVYTRTPAQNARTIWGRLFPGFAKREQRLYSEATLTDAVHHTPGTAPGLHRDLQSLPVQHPPTAQGSGRGPPLLDLLAVRARRATSGHRRLSGSPARSPGQLGRRASPGGGCCQPGSRPANTAGPRRSTSRAVKSSPPPGGDRYRGGGPDALILATASVCPRPGWLLTLCQLTRRQAARLLVGLDLGSSSRSPDRGWRQVALQYVSTRRGPPVFLLLDRNGVLHGQLWPGSDRPTGWVTQGPLE
jgi:SAM-dependent methyltransferase